MAKSISNGTDVTRVPDAEAKRMIAQGEWHYVPKNKFRRAARNYEKQMRLAMQRGRGKGRKANPEVHLINKSNVDAIINKALARKREITGGVEI